MKKTFTLFLLTVSALVLIGCNTMHGFGKDVEKVGEKVQQKSAK
ncbi:MAG: entericidin [Burkholderiales bacterium RIFCSPLOWO2_02_FULL_57_36]|nr:MAG: entericidin [Burkholderiales bacterium RIFCSPLOWO2_02_FULL_57_36]